SAPAPWSELYAEVRELCTNQPRAAPSSRPMKRPTNNSVIGSAELMFLLSHTYQTERLTTVLWIEDVFEKVARVGNLSLRLFDVGIRFRVDIDKLLESIPNAIVLDIG